MDELYKALAEVAVKLQGIGRGAPGRKPEPPAFAWWAICKRALCGKVILAGPFLTEMAADLHLANNRRQYGNAKVEVFCGMASREYRMLVGAVRLVIQNQTQQTTKEHTNG